MIANDKVNILFISIKYLIFAIIFAEFLCVEVVVINLMNLTCVRIPSNTKINSCVAYTSCGIA